MLISAHQCSLVVSCLTLVSLTGEASERDKDSEADALDYFGADDNEEEEEPSDTPPELNHLGVCHSLSQSI